MTSDDIHQHCEWEHSQAVPMRGHVQEVSVAQTKPTHTAYSTAAYIPNAVPDLITYLHVATGYQVKKTWIKAIQ